MFVVCSKEETSTPRPAQEAHEPIRPSILEIDGVDTFTDPASLPGTLPTTAVSMYELIYGRTVASLMVPKVVNSTAAVLHATTADGRSVEMKATGTVVVEQGFERA